MSDNIKLVVNLRTKCQGRKRLRSDRLEYIILQDGVDTVLYTAGDLHDKTAGRRYLINILRVEVCNIMLCDDQ